MPTFFKHIDGILEPRFPLGALYVSEVADRRIEATDIRTALMRHAHFDWGDVLDEDRLENEHAIDFGGRFFSVYRDRNNVQFWIITTASRDKTTVVLPTDY